MPQTLVEKIAEVAKSVPNLLKQGDNGEYPYLRAIDVFEAIRGKLFEKGVLILPAEILELTRSQPYVTVNDNIIDEIILREKFVITDGSQTLECVAAGVGHDYEGKALYMASTGAKKDLLKSLFLIAGYEDDAERVTDTQRIPDGLAEKLDEAEKKFGHDLREHPISRRDVVAFGKACQMGKRRNAAREEFLRSKGVEKITDLKRKDFQAAMDWALGESDEASRVDSGVE